MRKPQTDRIQTFLDVNKQAIPPLFGLEFVLPIRRDLFPLPPPFLTPILIAQEEEKPEFFASGVGWRGRTHARVEKSESTTPNCVSLSPSKSCNASKVTPFIRRR